MVSFEVSGYVCIALEVFTVLALVVFACVIHKEEEEDRDVD